MWLFAWEGSSVDMHLVMDLGRNHILALNTPSTAFCGDMLCSFQIWFFVT